MKLILFDLKFVPFSKLISILDTVLKISMIFVYLIKVNKFHQYLVKIFSFLHETYKFLK